MSHMKIKAIYEVDVLKPLGNLDLPDKALVSITNHESFSDLLDEPGEPVAMEDVEAVLKEMCRVLKEMRKRRNGSSLNCVCMDH